MTIQSRNEIFIEHQNLIRVTIYKNMTLLRALKLNPEDVSQDLAISALKAIEKYDPARGKKLSNYILDMLQYEVLQMRQRSNRYCRAASVPVISLDAPISDEDERTLEIPVEVDYDSSLVVQEALSILCENEKHVVGIYLAGGKPVDKRQCKYMDRARKKVARFYRGGNPAI